MAVSKAVHLRRPALRVTWTPPQSDGAITQYQVQYRGGRTSWRAVSPVTSRSNASTVLQALTSGTAYQVRIRAVSAIGNGEWSTVGSQTTYMSELSNELKVAFSQYDVMCVEQLSEL